MGVNRSILFAPCCKRVHLILDGATLKGEIDGLVLRFISPYLGYLICQITFYHQLPTVISEIPLPQSYIPVDKKNIS